MMTNRRLAVGRLHWNVALTLFGLLLITLSAAMPVAAMAPSKDGLRYGTSSDEGWEAGQWSTDVWALGGWWFGAYAPELGNLNDQLMDNGFDPFPETLGFFGGGGAGVRNGWYIGGFGGYSEITSSKQQKRAQLKIGLGGAEFARSLFIGRSQLQIGTILGGGNASLTLLDPTPDTAHPGFQNRFDTRFERRFFLVGPTVGAYVPLSDFFGFHLKAGYIYDLAGKWTYADRHDAISGLPTFSGTFVSLGFTFGGRFNIVVSH